MMNNVRVVLVGTSHAGNIGAAARAMKTMGLTRLVLVSPHRFPAAEATAMAAGADDLLARAECVDSLGQALAGCSLVVGSSARPRRLRMPVMTPRAVMQEVIAQPDSEEIALVFGRERTGLTNDELGFCHLLAEIPADPEYSSLNVAAAVQVMAYELRLAAGEDTVQAQRVAMAPLATSEEMQHFYSHLEEVLLQTGFLDQGNPRHLMRRLHRLFNRVRPDKNEINILRGILASVQTARGKPEKGGS